MGIQDVPPMAMAVGVVSGLFGHIAMLGAPLESARTYMPLISETNTQGMHDIRKLMRGVSHAAGSTSPELATISVAFAQLSGLLITDAATKQGNERSKGVGAALVFTMLADWAQPRNAASEPQPEFSGVIDALYTPLHMLASEHMKKTIECCQKAASMSHAIKGEGQEIYYPHLLAKAQAALAVMPAPKRIERADIR